MKNIVGIRFKKLGKIYFFNPKNIRVRKGEKVIVETAQGEEYGEVVIPNRRITDEKILEPLKKVIRIANKKDQKQFEDCKKLEEEAFKTCQKKIKEHKLPMNLTYVECKFDNSKILFYFTADGRIDFRELVKDLAAIYKTRIELKQIGVRDQVKRIGGIKMAKEQNISLNPSKISGNCGRLMCCLKYEDNVYTEKLAKLPKIGAIVETEDGEGEIDSIETLKERVRVKFKNEEGYSYKRYDAKDVKVIKDVETESEQIDEEELEHKQELEELENLEREDIKEEEEI